MVWRVTLDGSLEDLERLVGETEDTGLRIIKDGDEFRLESPEFDGLPHAADVYATAAELVPILNAAAMLDRHVLPPIAVKEVYVLSPSGSRTYSIVLEGGTTPTGTVSFPGAPAIPNAPWVTQALGRLSDLPVRFSLGYLGEGTWYGLYKAVEAIENACGGEAGLAHKGWIPPDELELLKRTANSRFRHAAGSFDPPQNEMTFQTARLNVVILIRRLVADVATSTP